MKRKNVLFLLAICMLFSNVLFSQNWLLTGNSSTNQTSNFVGTLDNQQLVFKTNNSIRMVVGRSSGLINPGAITIGDLNPEIGPDYGGLLRLRSPNNETSIDLVKSSSNTGNWDNQIRFYNTNALRHLIADDYTTGKLVIQTNVDPSSGSVDILDVRGRVQIGQVGPLSFPTPSGYNLYVANGILTEKVKVAIKTTSDWADYVFEKNYRLPSFTELEKFITLHKHLPGIPSATEMVKEGNDLAKTDAQLLAKIEELTLYIIKLNKEKEDLEKRVDELTKQAVQAISQTTLIAAIEDLKLKVDNLQKEAALNKK